MINENYKVLAKTDAELQNTTSLINYVVTMVVGDYLLIL